MTVQEALTTDSILLALKATDKEAAIREIASVLESSPAVTDFDLLLRDLFRRERNGGTGLEDGIALPHTRTEAVSDVVMAFGRSSEGVEFGSPDGRPAQLIFLLAAPKTDGQLYLKRLASLSRWLKRATFREALLQAERPEVVAGLIAEQESQ